MISARFLAAALMALTILAFPGIHATESGDCTGVILDENGVPVASARIQFESTISRIYRTETDSSGRFILRNLLSGDYKVEVRKAGFFLLTGQSFTLHAGPNELTLTLNHEQELHEQIQVTAPSNQIDTQDTSQRSTLTPATFATSPSPTPTFLWKASSPCPKSSATI